MNCVTLALEFVLGLLQHLAAVVVDFEAVDHFLAAILAQQRERVDQAFVDALFVALGGNAHGEPVGLAEVPIPDVVQGAAASTGR